MNPCANCGANPRPSDRFCNTCGTPVATAEPAPAPPAYTPSAAWGNPPPSQRCQMGHEVAIGQNYCPQGHPIALEQVQFAPPPPPYGPPASPPYAGAAAYAAPPPPPPGYTGTPAGGSSGSGSFGSGAKYAQAGQPAAPPPPAPPYGAAPPYAPQAPAYPPQSAYVPPPPPPPGYAPPAQAAPSGGAEPKPSPPVTPSALTGFLISYEANPSGDFWPLTGGRHTVGRANSGDSVSIPLADATISSRHAVIDVDALAGKVQVEDTGSTNGTFVNDEHVGFSGKRELRDGDKLRLGGFTTLVKVIARG